MTVKKIKHLHAKAKDDQPALVDMVAKAIHLTRAEQAVLKVLSAQANGFAPSLKLLEDRSSYSRQGVINARKALIAKGVVGETKSHLLIDWDRIRLFSTLDPLMTKSKAEVMKVEDNLSQKKHAERLPQYDFDEEYDEDEDDDPDATFTPYLFTPLPASTPAREAMIFFLCFAKISQVRGFIDSLCYFGVSQKIIDKIRVATREYGRDLGYAFVGWFYCNRDEQEVVDMMKYFRSDECRDMHNAFAKYRIREGMVPLLKQRHDEHGIHC